MTDEQDNIEIELSDADTVVKADTSVRSSVLEAQMYEEFENLGEILTSKSPEAGESDLESDYEDIESSSQQRQVLQNHSTRLEKQSWEELQAKYEEGILVLKTQGLSFEEVCSRLPHNSIRRVWKSKSANVKPERRSIRGDERILRMFQEGVDMHAETLNILDVILRFNLDKSHAQQGIYFGSPCRVWIEVFEPGNNQHRPWFEDTTYPELQCFIFKIALQNQGDQDSIPFYPKSQGILRGKMSSEEHVERKTSMARKIVRLFRKSSKVKHDLGG